MNLSCEIVEHGNSIPVPEIEEAFCLQLASSVFSNFPFLLSMDHVSFCIVHSNNSEIKKLNLKFRQKDKETNVLSFPLHEFAWKDLDSYKHRDSYIELGDIFFSIEKVRQEAKEEYKSFKDHYARLFVHSILHLIGYDHETDEDAEVMENLENKILKNYIQEKSCP